MPIEQEVPATAPVRIAWDAYTKTEDFENTLRWAVHEEHAKGSLWSAFFSGFFAGAMRGVESTSEAAFAATSELSRLRQQLEVARKEIAILRQFGNKDCTAMADEELERLGIIPPLE